MMKGFVVASVAVLQLSIPGVAQQVSVNYRHDQSLTLYHTHAWGGTNQWTSGATSV